MTRLSVNINKFATLRNARGGDNPNLIQVACDIQHFGAHGITVHPRPDERHIRYDDVRILQPYIYTEFNIEGNPTADFIKLIEEIKPHQVTLVPDDPSALTSDHGWDTRKHLDFLKEITAHFKQMGIRVSIFCDPDIDMVQGAAAAKVDRIELYTGPFAHIYIKDRELAIKEYILASRTALDMGLEINAGHDLDLNNLAFFLHSVPEISEVSIGHALICDALYYGLQSTIGMYLREIYKSKIR